jgi:hypothetical protein
MSSLKSACRLSCIPDIAPSGAAVTITRSAVGVSASIPINPVDESVALVLADLEETADEDTAGSMSKDFAAKGVAQSDHQIRRTMDQLLQGGPRQIKAGR